VTPLIDSPYALVAVGRPVRGEFTYGVPEALRGRLKPGQRLRVPFGRGTALGFYLAPAAEPAPDLAAKLKAIERPLELEASLPSDLVELVRFAAQHYRYPLGEALRAALPPGLTGAVDEREAKPDVVEYVRAALNADLTALGRAPAQHAALSYLLAVGGRCAVEEVAHAIPGAKETLRRLSARGLVQFEEEAILPTVREGLGQSRHVQLTQEQAIAVETLGASLAQGGYAPWLLHGVTGSGKTEVYLQLVERALAMEKGALILVPEIALTPQLVGRFRSRFGPAVAVLHSALKDRERLLAWQRLRRGELRLIVGVRSAIWAPVQNLGLIVVDEEHDPSFKQEEKLRYQARDLAIVRARQAACLVVLGSATPSLETLENVRRERYRCVTLTRRVDDRPMPTIELVDLREERPRTPDTRNVEPPILGPAMKRAIEETLARKQQVILFLNRRGHSTFVVCEVCGQSLKCTDCDVCLTHHTSSRRVQCHYCGRAEPLPVACPECQGPLLQLGLGTERIETEVAAAFPEARVARLDRDAASTAEQLTELLASFARREIDILVGTQMVAKGHDFPGVTLVCVVLADTALAMPDFRAAERTFHLLTQVAGRAGRGRDPGRVLVQSYNAEAAPIAFMLRGDYAGFSELELKRRQALAWPPYSRMALIRIDAESPDECARVAQRLGRVIERHLPPSSYGVRMLGPAKAPVSRVKGRTRWQIVLKGPSHAAMGRPLAAIEREMAELAHSVRVVIDVDPGALL
jgi:primosomal protein N' (replication factor Y)